MSSVQAAQEEEDELSKTMQREGAASPLSTPLIAGDGANASGSNLLTAPEEEGHGEEELRLKWTSKREGPTESGLQIVSVVNNQSSMVNFNQPIKSTFRPPVPSEAAATRLPEERAQRAGAEETTSSTTFRVSTASSSEATTTDVSTGPEPELPVKSSESEQVRQSESSMGEERARRVKKVPTRSRKLGELKEDEHPAGEESESATVTPSGSASTSRPVSAQTLVKGAPLAERPPSAPETAGVKLSDLEWTTEGLLSTSKPAEVPALETGLPAGSSAAAGTLQSVTKGAKEHLRPACKLAPAGSRREPQQSPDSLLRRLPARLSEHSEAQETEASSPDGSTSAPPSVGYGASATEDAALGGSRKGSRVESRPAKKGALVRELLVGPFNSEAEAPATITLSGVLYQKSARKSLPASESESIFALANNNWQPGEGSPTSGSGGGAAVRSSAQVEALLGGLKLANLEAQVERQRQLIDRGRSAAGKDPRGPSDAAAAPLEPYFGFPSAGGGLPGGVSSAAPKELSLAQKEAKSGGPAKVSTNYARQPDYKPDLEGESSGAGSSQQPAILWSSSKGSEKGRQYLLNSAQAEELYQPASSKLHQQHKEKAPIVIVQKDVKPVKYHLLRAYLKLRRLLRPFEATYIFQSDPPSLLARREGSQSGANPRKRSPPEGGGGAQLRGLDNRRKGQGRGIIYGPGSLTRGLVLSLPGAG